MNERKFTVYVALRDHRDDSTFIGEGLTFPSEDNALNHLSITGKRIMKELKL